MKSSDKLGQIFDNNFNCYADTNDESVVMAMDKERFIEVVKMILNSLKQLFEEENY